MMNENVRLDLLTGQAIGGRYKLMRLCGRGRFGCVYEGQQLLLGEPIRRVAVKLLNIPITLIEQQKEEFNDALLVIKLMEDAGTSREAQHVVNIFDLDVEEALENRPFIVMEYLERNVAHEIGDHNIGVGVKRSLECLEDILLGLSLLHGAQEPVLHRDLKPNNLLVDKHGSIKIADFGIATRRRVATAYGTYEYMAPESLRADVSTTQSDVYAVGLIGWELLTGRHPYAHRIGTAEGGEASLRAQEAQEESWTPLYDRVYEIKKGDELERWLYNCLAFREYDRFPNAMEALRQLKQVKDGMVIDGVAKKTRAEILIHIEQLISRSLYNEAVTESLGVLESYPDDERVIILLSRSLCELDRVQEAIDQVQKALRKRPSRELRFLLADCLEKAGYAQQASSLRALAQRSRA